MSSTMSPMVLLTAALSVGWLVWSFWYRVSPAKGLPGIPLVEFDGDNTRERYTKEAANLLGKGYDTHIKHGRPFSIRDFLNSGRPRVYLPLKYMEEHRNAPQEKLSLPGILNYTSTMTQVGGPQITEEIQDSARVDLNRALNKLIEPMQTLCFRAAEKEMPACPDWSSIVLYPKIMELFSRMSARVMVGPELCDAWPAISMRYITRTLTAQGAIRSRYWPSLYWTAYYFNPEVALVNEARREAAELVRPVVEARRAEYASSGAAAEKHDDFIQWIMDSYRAGGKTASPDDVVQNIFIVMFASMHGTSFIALQSLFSLIGTPGAVAEIREEIGRVSKDELRGSPVWTRHALGELRTLDSFMKETLRMKPFQEGKWPLYLLPPLPRSQGIILCLHNVATVQRYSMTSFTYKDGLHVPPATVVSFPNLRHNLDTNLVPNADTFDGKRWLRRRTGFDMSKFQFASTSEDAFDWGGGPHACPGRFMAEVTIKLILVYLVTHYDMKLSEEGPDRPKESRRFMDMTPDTSVPILMKDLQV